MSVDNRELVEKIALSTTKGVHAEIVRRMEEVGISTRDFFEMPSLELCDRLGISRSTMFSRQSRDETYHEAWEEVEFVKRHNIRCLYFGDEAYPDRLRECYDAPVMLYALGDADLDAEHMMSVVGTRKATQYGATFTHSLVKDLGESLCGNLTVVSGLAYGIDALAHSASLECGLPTVAVLAHGLNMIYPAAHRDLAQRIVKSGGALVTEYTSKQKALRPHFLERNRVVAGLCDVTIVSESDIKGGAMSTAQRALDYNREVMALPGRVNDEMSRGCNHLIRKQKASLIGSPADVMELMSWMPADVVVSPRQRVLFPDLTDEEKPVYDLLRLSGKEMTVDELHHTLSIPIVKLQVILMEMEFNGIIVKCPGNKVALSL